MRLKMMGNWVSLASLILWLLAADGQPSFGDLKTKTATKLAEYGIESAENGFLNLGFKALNRARALAPHLKQINEVQAALTNCQLQSPKASDPLTLEEHEEKLYEHRPKSRTILGWKSSKGKWTATDRGVLCESSVHHSILNRSGKALPHLYRLTLSLSLAPDGSAGLILGSSNKTKIGILCQTDGFQFWDFTNESAISEKVKQKLKPKRKHKLIVERQRTRYWVSINKKQLLYEDGEAGPLKLALYSQGANLFSEISLFPLESDLLLRSGRKAYKSRNFEKAASLLLRAESLDNANPLTKALLAECMWRLGFKERSCQAYNALLRLDPDPKELSLKKAVMASEKALQEERQAQETLDQILSSYVGAVKEIAYAACDSGEFEIAETGLDALKAIDSQRHIADDLSSRIFMMRRGGREGVTLFNEGAKTLDGWKTVHGQWEIDEEGFILGKCDLNSPGVLKADPLPGFERFLIRTRQRGTGAYLDQGIRLISGNSAYDFHLYKSLMGASKAVGKKITVEKNGSTVFFKSMHDVGLVSNRWYDVDLLVDLNRVTVLFNSKPLFTKVLDQPAKTEFALYISPNCKGRFGQIIFKPLGNESEYTAYLKGLGLNPKCVLECESVCSGSYGGKGKKREFPFAYNGFVLTGAPGEKDPIKLRFKSLNMTDAVASLRYSSPKGESRLAIRLDNKKLPEDLVLPRTPSRNDFEYRSLGIGPLDSGWHTLELSGKSIAFLDRLEITEAGAAPKGENKICASEAAKHFKIRLSPGLVLPENSEELFELLEILREHMVEYYGFEPINPLYYNLISRDCWADPHKGGYASGDNFYIPDDVSFSNIAVIIHEMSHCFDRGRGYNPPWFGEGKSFPCYAAFVEKTKRKYRKYRTAFGLSAKDTGAKSLQMLEKNGENLFQYWGTEKFPYWGGSEENRGLTTHGYKASNWFCYHLSRRIGPTWLKDYFALLQQDQEGDSYFMPKDREYANSVIADYFARSSGQGEKVLEFFRSKRFKIRDIYKYESLVVDYANGDGDYLVKSEGVQWVDLKEKGKKARGINNGFIQYVFPVDNEAKTVNLTITRSGRGQCRAEGAPVFKGFTGERAVTKTYVLRNPSLWEDWRLEVRFASDTTRSDFLVLRKIEISY